MQINVHNADKRVGRGANLINALIGCISRKWQTTYNVIWVGGHVEEAYWGLYGASLLNKFTDKQLTTVTLQLIVTQAFQGKHTALTSIKIQLLTEINYIWSTSLWRRDPINLVSLTAFARTKKKPEAESALRYTVRACWLSALILFLKMSMFSVFKWNLHHQLMQIFPCLSQKNCKRKRALTISSLEITQNGRVLWGFTPLYWTALHNVVLYCCLLFY